MEALKTFKIILNEGGSRSSKTISIFQIFIIKALAGEKFTLTIARDKLTWVKETLLKDFEELTGMYNLPVTPAINRNRAEQVYKIFNAEFTFWGLDTPAKAHGKKQDYVWLNEVMDIDKKSFDQLEMRTIKQMILDYNPVDDTHWVFPLQLRPDVCVIKSSMLDNPFNPDTVIRKIKSYEPNDENIKNGTADLFLWEVYGLGKKARLQGAVFTNWDVVGGIPDGAEFKGFGKDWGYSQDPTTLIELWMFNNEIYLNEILYKTGLLNPDVIKEYERLEVRKSDEIIADSNDPKSIEELYRAGYNIKGAEKGPDSVMFGILLMQGYKIRLTKNSQNLEKEFRRYKWAEDKNGEPLKRNGHSIPIDKFNHGIDAARYIITHVLKKKLEVKLYPAGYIG